MVLLTLTGRNKDGIKFHLKFPASKELDRSSLKSCADDTRVDNLIKKAVTTFFCYKYLIEEINNHPSQNNLSYLKSVIFRESKAMY